MFKKIINIFIVIAVLITLALPAFAVEGVSEITAAANSMEYAVAKAVGSGVKYSTTSIDGYPYDIQVTFNGIPTKVYLVTRPDVSDISVQMGKDGSLDIAGIGSGDATQWNNLFSKYRTAIVGISGLGAITMILFFIIAFMKLGASVGNPQARSQAIVAIVVTGIAAAGLGAVAIIAGFFYNAI